MEEVGAETASLNEMRVAEQEPRDFPHLAKRGRDMGHPVWWQGKDKGDNPLIPPLIFLLLLSGVRNTTTASAAHP